jgi:ribosomal protein S24E
MNITEKKEEPLLSRVLVRAKIEFKDITPSYKDVLSALAVTLKKDEKLIAIRHLYQSFGNKTAEVVAYVYADEKKKSMIEPKSKKETAKPAQDAEEKPAESAKAAPNAEEKKEVK